MNTPSTLHLDLPIIIIAGGQSQRLRLENYHRKWQLPFGNDTLLQHMVDLASHVSNTVVINSSDNDRESLSRYEHTVITDDRSQGPLSGIMRALLWGNENNHENIMTIPCDTPFLSAQWLCYLYEQYKTSNKKAVISCHNEDVHPLCGVWSVQLSDNLADFMLSNEKKAVYRWATQHAQCIDYKKINNDKNREIDPFMNINTQEDYEKALKIKATMARNQNI